MNWAALATLAVVLVVYAGIYLLRRRNVSFTVATLIALAAGVPIGLLAGHNVEYIDPIGKIYLNVLLACVAPLVFIAIVSSVTSLGNLAKLRSIGATLRSSPNVPDHRVDVAMDCRKRRPHLGDVAPWRADVQERDAKPPDVVNLARVDDADEGITHDHRVEIRRRERRR